MGTFGFKGLKTPVSAALAIVLTSLLAWAFASSAASIEWLGGGTDATTMLARCHASSHAQSV
jgi:hypothetical protein